jgi:hypothetical protein
MTAVCTARGGDDSNNNINRSAAECLQSLSEQDEVRRCWARSPTQPSRWQLQHQQYGQQKYEVSSTEQDHSNDGADLDRSLAEAPAAPSRELMDLIVAKSWHRAARLCQSSPRLARYRGPTIAAPTTTAAAATAACSGAEPTCLFAACQNRPPVRVVQALLAAHPEAAGIECQLSDSPSITGEGAVSTATNSNTSNETATPEASSVNSRSSSTDRWLPLHMACRYNASLAVLQTLLTHHPEASLHDGAAIKTTAMTPSLSSLSYPVNELYDHRDTFESSFAPTNYRSVFWQKVGALLRAMAECRRSTLGHVAAMSGIPDLLDYALCTVNNNSSASTMPPVSTPHLVNAQGQTPLHVALLRAETFPATPISTNVLTIVTKLLAHDASMANEPDPQGRYPLHYALSLHCHPHVHAVTLKVLQAVPGSVTLEDPVTRLFPFQMAASLSTVAADVVDVEVVYRILRTHPSALGRCRNDHAVRILGNTSACSESSNSVSDVNDELTMPFEPIHPPSKEEVLTEHIRAVSEPSEPEPTEPEPTEPELVEPLGLDSPTDGEHDSEPEQQQQQQQHHHGDEDEDGFDEATVVSQPKVLQGKLEDAWTMKTRSCPSSPAKPQRGAVSMSASAHGPKSITLSDFFQSPRTNKKKPFTCRESSTVAMAFNEAMSADTCLLSGTVDFDDEEDVDNRTREAEESVAVREESDPIVRSINGMCSGALLLLTTMFHNSSADALGSSSHHVKQY